MSGENRPAMLRLAFVQTDDFHVRAATYLQVLEAEIDSLEGVSTVFEEGNEIWPDQCKRAISVIDDISEPIQQICRLLEDPTCLPDTIIPHRYPLVATLQLVDEQAQELLSLLRKLRHLCRTTSKQVDTLLREIQSSFDLFLRGYKDATVNLRMLPDRAAFQKRKIIALSDAFRTAPDEPYSAKKN